MNATPNMNNWLVNIDAIALETKKLEAKKEILQNIQDFALLFQRIQEASNMDEFNRIVSEDAEAANDSVFNEVPKTVKVSNEPLYKVPEPVNITLDDDTNNSEIISWDTNNSEIISWDTNNSEVSEITETTEDVKETVAKYEDDFPTPPKIKLNLGWFGKPANDEKAEDEQKAA